MGEFILMAAMMALPWGLVEISDTPIIYPIIWDILLSLHLISLLIPKDMLLLKHTYLPMDNDMNGNDLNCLKARLRGE